MLKFFNDYDKVNKVDPNQSAPAASSEQDPTPAGLKPETVPAMTVDDVKSYFDAMKESLLSELKEQMAAYQTSSDANNNGGEDNASSTDLSDS